MFKRKGFKYKYTFMLGSLDKPDSMNMVDSWEKEELTVDEIEERKRTMMKNYKQPVINVEVAEI